MARTVKQSQLIFIENEMLQSLPCVIANEAWQSLIKNVITRSEATW